MRTTHEHTDLAIISPADTILAPPKSLSRRGMLSTMGAMGAGIALPASVGGLSLLAAGAANAAIPPAGTQVLTINFSNSVPQTGVSLRKYYDYYYVASNSSGNPEVNVYIRSKTVYQSPALTTESWSTKQGRSAKNSSNLITFDAAGTNVCQIPVADLNGTAAGMGTCRRLNASGTENLAAAFAVAGWTQDAPVVAKRLFNSAAEFIYIRYREINGGRTAYRFFERAADQAAGGLTATTAIIYTGASSQVQKACNNVIDGVTAITSAVNTVIGLGVTSLLGTIVGVAIGGTNAFTNSTILATSAGCLAAITAGGSAYTAYWTLSEKMTTTRTALGYWAQNPVADGYDCV